MHDSIQASYQEHVNPYLAEVLEALHLDRHYVKGEGSWLYDDEERRYLDFIAGYGALPFGHAPSFASEPVARYLANHEPALVQPSVLGPASRLAERLTSLAPEGLRYAWFANSGAEAVEAALKACRAATGRPGVVYARGSFHGKTLGALSATGAQKYQAPFFAPIGEFQAVPYGDEAALADLLAAEGARIACVILEPIQGEGGIVVPPAGYLQAVRRLCDEHGVLLVLDEVQTGFGRTGTLFAADHEGVAPDCMTLSKALGGGIVPIGCCLLNEKAFCQDFALYHSSTFAGNGFSCGIALAAVEALLDPAADLLANVQARGGQLLAGLQRLAERYPGVVKSVRGRGLLLGVELAFKRASARQSFGATLEALSNQGNLIPVISSYLLNVHGVRTAPTLTSGRVLRVEPPLNVSADQCDQFLDALEQALHLLARGDTGTLIEHLVLEPHEQAQPHVIATPDESLNVDLPEAQPQDSRVAFLIHTLDERTMMEFDASLQRFSEPALRRAALLAEQFLEPFVSARARVTSGDASVYCEFISVPKLSDSLLALSSDQAEQEIAAAVQLARDRGAQLVGLGAYTSVITQGGTRVTKYGVPITTGNTYTVITALLAVEDAVKKIGLPLDQAHMVVIGATGMIGSSLVDTFLGRTARFTLIGNPAKAAATRRRLLSHLEATLAQEVVGDAAREAFFAADPEAAEQLQAGRHAELAERLVDGKTALPVACGVHVEPYLADADIVICATSSTEFLVDVAKLKHGAVVLDLSRPSNVDRATLDARPDVLFIDGGVVAFPNNPDLGFDFGFPRGHGFACMAETMMLGLARRYEHCSIGIRIDRETRVMVAGLAERFGFRLSGLRSFNRKMNDADWQSYVNARSGDAAATGHAAHAPNGAGLSWVAEPAVRLLQPSDPPNICEWLINRHLAARGRATAVVAGNQAVTYAMLDRLGRIGALRLRKAGVFPGDFVALVGRDSPSLVAAMLACWRLGAIAVPINPNLPAGDHLAMLATIKPRRVLLDERYQVFADRFQSTGYVCESLEHCVADTDVVPALAVHPVGFETPAVALFSSGSTGRPKPVLHSHGDLLAVNLNYVPTIVALQPGEVVFSPSRMFFAYGLNSVVFALFAGGTAVLAPDTPKPAAILEALAKHRVNVLFSVPTVLKLLFAEWPQAGVPLPALRLCVSAGETLPPSLYALALERFGVEIIDGIGTTEVLSTFISNRPGESRPNCTGLAVPGFEVRLVNERGETCAVGETGTLWVRGNTLAPGIHGDPALSGQVFRDGWFNTKDLFYMDAGRRFHYVGRANDVLKINGCWVAPHQIEESLKRHPQVADCAVVPVADEFGLLRPKAFVVTQSPVDDFERLWKELKAFAKQHIGAHQYPHLFEPVAQLPRTASGKLQRAQLLARETK